MPLHIVIFCCAHGSASASENLKESGHKKSTTLDHWWPKTSDYYMAEVNAAF